MKKNQKNPVSAIAGGLGSADHSEPEPTSGLNSDGWHHPREHFYVMQEKEKCIYCGLRPGDTRDHVPPKGFFQKKVPNDAQLITVPCCETCRKSDEKNDTLIRNVFTSLIETEPSDYVRKHLLSRRDRSFERGFKNRTDIMGLVEMTEAFTKDGRTLGEWPAFKLNDPRFHRFFERLARALIYHEFREGYFGASVGWVPKVEFPDEAYQFMATKYPCRRILGVLTYSVTREFDSGVRWIIADFFDRFQCLIRVERLKR